MILKKGTKYSVQFWLQKIEFVHTKEKREWSPKISNYKWGIRGSYTFIMSCRRRGEVYKHTFHAPLQMQSKTSVFSCLINHRLCSQRETCIRNQAILEYTQTFLSLVRSLVVDVHLRNSHVCCSECAMSMWLLLKKWYVLLPGKYT